jgi:hypothetical protein
MPLGSCRRNWCTASLVAVLMLLAIPSGSHASGAAQEIHLAPLPDISATPHGWSPLSLGAVQISVPSNWFIEAPTGVCGGGRGEVFVNLPSGRSSSRVACPTPANIVKLSESSSGHLEHLHHAVINSIAVSESLTRSGSSQSVTVQALGDRIFAQGPLALRVIRTITHSPESVVLHSSVDAVPASWRHVVFGGLNFAVPSQWSTQTQSGWNGCPYNLEAGVLELNTATSFDAPGCPPPPGTARYLAAASAMEVGSGPLVPIPPSDATCLNRNGLRFCIDPFPSSIDDGDVPGHEVNLLTAQVRAPGQADWDQIEIGLTGNGTTPLRIFDSITPVS